MAKRIDRQNEQICDYENEVRVKDVYIKEVEDENDILYNKIKKYENGNEKAMNKFTEFLRQVGRSVPEDFKRTSEKKYNDMLENMRHARLERRNMN